MSREVEEQIKRLVVGLAKRQLLDFLVKKAAFFALPVVNPLAGWIIGFVLEKALEVTILGVTLAYIELDVNGDVKEVKRILEKIAQKKLENASEEELRKLDDDLAKAALKLISFVGS